MKKIFGAFQFLSIVPLKIKGEVKGCSSFFPLVGWSFGGILFLISSLTLELPQPVRAFIILLVWETLSWGFHLDGLADTADAFIVVKDKTRTLEILDDPHIGAFGATAIFLLLAGKLAFLLSLKPKVLGLSLLLSVVIARFFIVPLSLVFPPAKKEGLGFIIISSTGKKELIIATILTLPLLFLVPTLVGWLCSLTLTPLFLLAYFVYQRIGGLTGDVLGAILEIAELVILMVFLFV